jgi:hypothetical protein
MNAPAQERRLRWLRVTGNARRLNMPAWVYTSLRRPRVCIRWLQLALVASCLQCWLHAQIVANNNILTVTTPNLTATFSGADLVGLTNSLTGESYLKPQGGSQLLNLTQMNPTGLPLTLSNWTVGTDVSTQQQTASLTFQDTVRNGTFSVTIDPKTQELVIHLSGQSQTPGIEGLEWGIAGIDLSSGGRIVLPSNGGNYVDLNHFAAVQIQYPVSWAAQMALFEGAQGGFLVYSTDTTFQFKDLYVNGAGGSTANLQLSTEAVAPWPSATSVAPIEWRITAFAGDWRAGASAYKTWSRATWPLMSPSGATAWVRQIDFAISIDEEPNSTSVLDTLATLVNPHKTLLLLINWTVDGFDTNYPDYNPNPNLKVTVQLGLFIGQERGNLLMAAMTGNRG